MAKDKFYDIEKMAEIILILKEKFGNDRVINYLFERLIRNESDHIPFLYKSKGVLKLEKQYKVSIAGLSRIQTRRIKELKRKIIIEHGLPESQAIEMCFKSNTKEEIKTVLEELKKNLVCITVDEDQKLERGKQRRKCPSGFYWEEAYKKCGIDVVENPLLNHDVVSVPDGKLSKEQAIAVVNQKHRLNLNNSNTMFSNIDAAGKCWGITRDNERFNIDTHMILNDQNNRKLYYFFIKGGEIKTPSAIFRQRQDKPNHSMLYFEALLDEDFKEKCSRCDFGKYKTDIISY